MSAPVISHGQERGYRQHRYYGSTPCRSCVEAHAEYERARRASAPAAPRELVPCGRASAWRRHIRRGEKPCAACVLAHRAEVARYAPRRRGAA